ncbi:MAG: CvpA family protein [Burkholderiales bacterium]|nr:CvpA family protein [Burkholderiales bacterium]
MTWFDITVLAILGLSVLLGVLRGLVKEVMAIAAWVAAFVFARTFASTAAHWLPETLQPEALRYAAGFVALLFGALLLLWLVTYFVSQLLKATGLSVTDRTLGAIFGFVRGVLIVLVVVLIAGLTPVPKEPGWRNAWFSAPFEAAAMAGKAWLPEAIKTRIRYD